MPRGCFEFILQQKDVFNFPKQMMLEALCESRQEAGVWAHATESNRGFSDQGERAIFSYTKKLSQEC